MVLWCSFLYQAKYRNWPNISNIVLIFFSNLYARSIDVADRISPNYVKLGLLIEGDKNYKSPLKGFASSRIHNLLVNIFDICTLNRNMLVHISTKSETQRKYENIKSTNHKLSIAQIVKRLFSISKHQIYHSYFGLMRF